MTKTLLQKALEYKKNKQTLYKTVTREDLELALAWIDGRISSVQLLSAKGTSISGSKLYQFITNTLRYATIQGWLDWRIIYDPMGKEEKDYYEKLKS